MDTAYTTLDLGSDKALRTRFFTVASRAHGAKMHVGLLLWLLERYAQPGQTVIDPMYGIGTTGLAARYQCDVIGFEIEPPYLAHAHENAARICREAGLFAGSITIRDHDARQDWGVMGDLVLFSPPYGCRASVSNTSRHIVSLKLQRNPELFGKRWRQFLSAPTPGAAAAQVFRYGDHPSQIGHLRGVRYWEAMEQVYRQALAALRPDGHMILVIKDHIRDGQRVQVADETAERCQALGFSLAERLARRVWPLSLWQRRRRERGEPIIEEEDVLVFSR